MVPPNFVKLYLFFMFANPENFMCLARVVKNLEFWQPRLGELICFGIPKLCQILFFVYIYLPLKFHVSNF